MRSFIAVASVLGISIAATSAQAGIIVTVGKPCPELTIRQSKPGPDGQRQQAAPEGLETSGETRCVVMPDGQTRCGQVMRVETVSMLPADWRCIPVAKATLYCETPTFGGAPGAAGEGSYDPAAQQDEMFDDEEIQALGCSGGAGTGGLAGIAGGIVLAAWYRRRRRAADLG